MIKSSPFGGRGEGGRQKLNAQTLRKIGKQTIQKHVNTNAF